MNYYEKEFANHTKSEGWKYEETSEPLESQYVKPGQALMEFIEKLYKHKIAVLKKYIHISITTKRSVYPACSFLKSGVLALQAERETLLAGSQKSN